MNQPKRSDIHARHAFQGTSFSPEKREEQYINLYLERMGEVRTMFDQWRTDENSNQMDEALERFRAKYAAMENNYLAAHSRVMSTMITGPANFPVRSNQKKSETADKRRREWIEWEEKAIKKMRSQFDPQAIASAPIMTGDDDALERLQEKLKKAQHWHDLMKQGNKVARDKNLTEEQKREELAKLFGDKVTHEIMKPDYRGRPGFEGWQLSNSNANIRRLKGRIEQQERLAKQETKTAEVAGQVKIVRNTEAYRLQLIFPDKPDTAVRSILKSNGFRWSPSAGAWQRYLNQNSEFALNRVLPTIKEHYPDK